MDSSEQQWIRECVAGRTRTFGLLVRRYQDRVYNTVFRMVGRREDARDLVQETFIRAYGALEQFQCNSSFYTWLCRIAINACLSARRRDQRRPRTVSLEGNPSSDAPAADPDSGRPSATAESNECREAVRRAIASLPDDQRTVVVLKDIEGHSYEAIADIVQCPVGTVRSRLHRARMQLRDKLKDWSTAV